MITYREKLEAVSAACVRANPDLLKRLGSHSGGVADMSDRIRLIDVKWLLMQDFSDRRCEANIEGLSFWWNLQNDALTSQSDECIGFVHDILRYLNC